jgi:RecA-family ATPase
VNLSDPIRLLESLEPLVAEHRAKLIIIDSLYWFQPRGKNAANDQSQMTPIMEALTMLAARSGAAVVVMAHDNKGHQDLAGSFVIRAASKVIIRLVMPSWAAAQFDPDIGPDTRERVVRRERSKVGIPGAWRIRLDYPRWHYHGTVKDMREKDREQHLLDAVRRNPGSTTEDLARTIKRRKADVTKDLTRLVAGVKVEMREVPASEQGGRPCKVYYIRREPV